MSVDKANIGKFVIVKEHNSVAGQIVGTFMDSHYMVHIEGCPEVPDNQVSPYWQLDGNDVEYYNTEETIDIPNPPVGEFVGWIRSEHISIINTTLKREKICQK